MASLHALHPAHRTLFPMLYHLPDVLDVSHVQWYIFSGLDDITPIRLQPVPPAHRTSARAIQRAYRGHLRRRREARMLALAMSQHPRLGAASPAAALDPDVLALIQSRLI
jgi:hypothetical protein